MIIISVVSFLEDKSLLVDHTGKLSVDGIDDMGSCNSIPTDPASFVSLFCKHINLLYQTGEHFLKKWFSPKIIILIWSGVKILWNHLNFYVP